MSRDPRQPDATKADKTAKPDWFPTIEHSEGLATYKDWIRAILTRANALNSGPEHLKKVYRNVIEGQISPRSGNATVDWRGVRSAVPYETILFAAILEKTTRGQDIRALVDSELSGNAQYSHEATQLRRTVHIADLDEKWRQALFQRLYERHFVSVDLSLDDKALTDHFSEWLKHARESEGVKSSGSRRAPITHKSLQRWNDSRILAAYDLMVWRKLTGSKYTDTAIAAWLWPDGDPANSKQYVDRTERLRKVTKPLVRQVFDWRMVLRLDRAWAQESYSGR